MPKAIMLVGAPELGPCDESDLTVRHLLPAFRHVADDQGVSRSQPAHEPWASSSSPRAVWRSLPLGDQYLHTGWSQPDWIYANPVTPIRQYDGSDGDTEAESSFLTVTSGPLGDNDEQEGIGSSELSQHLEDSFILHEQASSAQVTPALKTPLFRKQKALDGGLNSRDKGLPELPSSSPVAPEVGLPLSTGLQDPETPLISRVRCRLPYLADLCTFPSTSDLRALEPQTVTFDIVVGILSISPARTVKIRRTGQDIDLIEVLVGDETHAGFSITFWLPEQRATNDLRTVVESLRQGDVVGMRNIAMSHFKGKVHGQSLGGRGKVGWETKLFTAVQMDRDRYGQLSGRHVAWEGKLQRVKAWVKDFIRPRPKGEQQQQRNQTKKRRIDVSCNDQLPLDESQL